MTAKILLISASKTENMHIQKTLSEYNILAASCLSDASEKIASNEDIDLILLDLNLPDKGAFDILKTLKHIKRAKTLRTIVLTEDALLDKAAQALQAGANDYFDFKWYLDLE